MFAVPLVIIIDSGDFVKLGRNFIRFTWITFSSSLNRRNTEFSVRKETFITPTIRLASILLYHCPPFPLNRLRSLPVPMAAARILSWESSIRSVMRSVFLLQMMCLMSCWMKERSMPVCTAVKKNLFRNIWTQNTVKLLFPSLNRRFMITVYIFWMNRRTVFLLTVSWSWKNL